MGFGGYHPYPRRFGGSANQPLEVMHRALNTARGSAYEPAVGSLVWLENMAWARALTFDGWGLNQRAANQADPYRTTDMLQRWENIFGIRSTRTLTDAERRVALVRRWQRFGALASNSKLVTALQDELGEFFGAVEYISLSNAIVVSPDASYPWGVQVDGIPWMSTVAHILVLLVKPAGATEAEFYAAAGKVIPILDPLVPWYVTIDWYRESACHAGIAVPGGPSKAGFWLDCPHNLDNNVFDV